MSRGMLIRRPVLVWMSGRNAVPATLCLPTMPYSCQAVPGSFLMPAFEAASRNLRHATTNKRRSLLTAAPGRSIKSP